MIREEVEPLKRVDGCIVGASDLWSRQGSFKQIINCGELLDCVESLLGPNIEFLRNRHNHAFLRRKGWTQSLELHRDVMQWSRTRLSLMIYLEPASIESGCTLVIPGSHLLPSFSSDEYLSEAGILEQAIPIPMPAGGILAMDGFVIHRAGTNESDRTRLTMTLAYQCVDELTEHEVSSRVLVRGKRLYLGNDRHRG